MAGQAGDREPGLRASDADRDVVLAELGEGFVAGRLSHETFVSRVDATMRARRRAELDDQVADLPRPRRSRPLLARARDLRRTVQAAAGAWRRPSGPGWPGRPGRPGWPELVLPADSRARYTIGREWACDRSVGDMSVSRWHAELRRDPAGGWLLADLGSTNGTRLNGWRITEPVPVHPGDLVCFGAVTFVLAQGPAASR
jgi:hypothetical protein